MEDHRAPVPVAELLEEREALLAQGLGGGKVAGEPRRTGERSERVRARSGGRGCRTGMVEQRLEPAHPLRRVLRPEVLERAREVEASSISPLPKTQASAARKLSCSANATSNRWPPGRRSPALRFAARATSRKNSACRCWISSASGASR